MTDEDRAVKELRKLINFRRSLKLKVFGSCLLETIGVLWVKVPNVENEELEILKVTSVLKACKTLGIKYELKETVRESRWLWKLLFNVKPLVERSILITF